MSKLKAALGIDIGGTNTVFGLIDENGKNIKSSMIPTLSSNSAENLFARLFENLFNDYSNELKEIEIVGIGVGAPNANFYKGTVENPPNLRWGTINLRDIIRKHYDCPIIITNDAKAAALGELKFGAAKGMKNFIEITLGTGLGSGIVVNGELVYGADGLAGELGHTIAKTGGRLCNCGTKGCLETYVSATGIKRTVFELLSKKNDDSPLRKVTFDDLDSKLIYESATKGDSIALQAFDETAQILGSALAYTVALLSPEAFIFFGGLAKAGELLLNPAKNYMEENLIPVFRNKVKILKSALPEDEVAILGAGALIWHEINK
ncbi:MAG: ROK family protein [Ignavibacteria bacterium]|jgi:glucokinase